MARRGEVPESVISYVLMGGLILSVGVEVVGILAYYGQSGGFALEFTSQWQMTGSNFFAYALNLLYLIPSTGVPTIIMALGIVLLMLTSYTRVFVTFLYFGFARNRKYAAVSIILFFLLSLTLLAH